MVFGFGRAQQATAPARDSSEDVQMHAIKAAILNEVRMNAGRTMPTLEHYRQAFMENQDVQAMVADGLIKPENLNAIAADLSGQNLNGFKLTEPKAQEEFRQRQAATSRHDLLDQDGNHEINVSATAPFYDRIRLDGASLQGAWVEPASSFNDQIAKAGNRNNMTFNGLTDGETFTFPAGEYNNTRVTSIDGGVIAFAPGAIANHVALDGREAAVEIGANARVSNLTTNPNFRIVTLDMQPGAELAHSDLRETLVSMSSELSGAALRDIKLSENVSGLDLSSAKIHNLSIGNRPVTSREQLAALGVTVDGNTRVSASQEFVQQSQMEMAMAAARKVPMFGDSLKSLAALQEKTPAVQAEQEPQFAMKQTAFKEYAQQDVFLDGKAITTREERAAVMPTLTNAGGLASLAGRITTLAPVEGPAPADLVTPLKLQVADANFALVESIGGGAKVAEGKPAEIAAAQAQAAATLPPRSSR